MQFGLAFWSLLARIWLDSGGKLEPSWHQNLKKEVPQGGQKSDRKKGPGECRKPPGSPGPGSSGPLRVLNPRAQRARLAALAGPWDSPLRALAGSQARWWIKIWSSSHQQFCTNLTTILSNAVEIRSKSSRNPCNVLSKVLWKNDRNMIKIL